MFIKMNIKFELKNHPNSYIYIFEMNNLFVRRLKIIIIAIYKHIFTVNI